MFIVVMVDEGGTDTASVTEFDNEESAVQNAKDSICEDRVVYVAEVVYKTAIILKKIKEDR
jgi:hypothetical protein